MATRTEPFEPQVGRSVSLEQAAQLLGVSRRTVYNRIRAGQLQTIRTLGGSQRVLLASVAQAGEGPTVPFASSAPNSPSLRTLVRTATIAIGLVASIAASGYAAGRARLSGDLAEQLAAGSQSIDVIVQGTQAAVDDVASRYGVTITRRLKSGAVLRVNAGQLDAIAADGAFDHLSGNARIESSMAITNPAIGANQLWQGEDGLPALNGKGITVAVIDSGIDARHNALKGRVVATVDFTGGDGSDHFGHGTHVAGIVAGQPGRIPDARTIEGVSAGAYLINVRVLGDDGSGLASDVLEAIDWAIDHKKQYNIGVINLSLGTPVVQSYRDDPLCQAVERAVAAGIVVVAAAGNAGTNDQGQMVYGGITSPGNDPFALTVGALNTHGTPQRSDDTLASYSSRGPTAIDLNIKPDVVAPGNRIVSSEASGSYLVTTYPELHVMGNGPNAYMRLSGTSMAAGVVSGMAALLLEENKNLTPIDVKTVVQLTSSFMPDDGLLGAGAGSVNVLAAALFVERPSQKLATTTIAGQQVTSSGVFIPPFAGTSRSAIVWDSAIFGRSSIVWDSSALGRSSIVWDSAVLGRTSIVWDSSIVGRSSIVWDSAIAGRTSIVWDSSAAGRSSIVWDSSTAGRLSIVWDSTSIGRSSIVWDSAATGRSSIVWDSAVASRSSIVWDSAVSNRSSIVWDSSL
jgi:serine protease AprX